MWFIFIQAYWFYIRTAYSPCLLAETTGIGLFRRESSNSAGGTLTHKRNHLHRLLRCVTEK
jgi:hypothetical protein